MKPVLLALALLGAQEKTVERLIEELGAEEPQARDAAEAELFKRGAPALPALEKAAQNDDLEVAGRARSLLARIWNRRMTHAAVERVLNPFARFGRADRFEVAPDERTALGSDPEYLRIWDFPHGRLLHAWKPHERGLRGFTLSPDGRRLLTWASGPGEEAALWEHPSAKLVRRFDGAALSLHFGPYRFTPDGKEFVGGLSERGTGRVWLARWEAETGKELRRYGRFEGYIAGTAVSRDRVAASGRDGPLAVWDLASGKLLWEQRPGKNARWLAFTPDGASLLAGDDDGRAARYEAAGGKVEQLYREKGPRILKGALSRDGRQAVLLSDQAPPALWDAAEGKLLHAFTYDGYGGGAFTRGGEEFVYGSPVTTVSTRSGRLLSRGSAGALRAAAVDSTRTRLAVLFNNNRFMVADLATGRTVWEFDPGFQALDFVLGREARRVLLFDNRGTAAGAGFGMDKPDVSSADLRIRGGDPERNRAFADDGTARDLRTLDVVGAADCQAHWIRTPPGSAWAYAARPGSVFRLDRDTLEGEEILQTAGVMEALDADAKGRLLYRRDFYDPGGRLAGTVATPLPGPLFRSFFAADGERLLVVLADGQVVFLKPGD